MCTNHISGTVEATVVKFCTEVDYVKSQHKNDKSHLKGAWSGSCDPLYILGPSVISLEWLKPESSNFAYRFRSVLFFSCPQSEGWPHHGRNFSIYVCPLSSWLTFPWGVLSTYWCCPSRPCVFFLSCVHLALFLALSLSPGNCLVSSWCDHSMLTSLLWQCLIVPFLIQLC